MQGKLWMLVAFLIAPPAVFAANVVPLTVGTTTITFPEQPGYVALSSSFPRAFSLAAAAIPPSNKLIESFITQADLQRLRDGAALNDPYYQIQTQRKLSSLVISLKQWKDAKPSMTAGMATFDTSKLTHDEEQGASKRISALTHKTFNVRLGHINSPTIYRETPNSIRFDMRVPISVSASNANEKVDMLGAGSITLLHNKLVYVYIFGRSDQHNDFASLNKRLDATVDKMTELDPNSATL